ncbi:MAG: hypothetical protein A2600_05585 [Candidatus Lambdaproteobacteria bacterium RIFOXYD1_FULL_56_27]|uniref:Autotransporter domain-containing protein n=1 Tax=Candidatus Lambdaproteobacteria bacterium RIFOXYD2_FULL_56_26 TaxID=1817773 RepID=A0A1F6GR98_9PROT|nr:MAG: hypothetical protein A2426_10790 [Candidatus Lambdaproteobacteria bacterium RIFOXYC1_FULL_56_13]OGH00673.1 MAG: hypothetical protein A2557_03290 [Candidatus Lambdaproteobacteria bacterium RIFOXYD2_FULL_56_26]OGH07840.1 MAG: hypothetical protein A2600_05585 [Candidatus Lambdaproteobacteria bacterium RIFOXYD1_FULL_56_27]
MKKLSLLGLGLVVSWQSLFAAGLSVTGVGWGLDGNASKKSQSQVSATLFVPQSLNVGWEVGMDETMIQNKTSDDVNELGIGVVWNWVGLANSFAVGAKTLNSSASANKGAQAVDFSYHRFNGYKWSVGLDLGQSSYPNYPITSGGTGFSVTQISPSASVSVTSRTSASFAFDMINLSKDPGYVGTSFNSFSATLSLFLNRGSIWAGSWSGKRAFYQGGRAQTLYSTPLIFKGGTNLGASYVLGATSSMNLTVAQDTYQESTYGTDLKETIVALGYGKSF